MKKHILISMLIALCGYGTVQAQSFSGLETITGRNLFTHGLVKFSLQHTSHSGTYATTLSGPGIGGGLRRESYQKYGWRWDYETALGYVTNMLYNTLKDKNWNKYNDHTFISPGLIGWHKATINVLATDRLLISPGFGAGDHMISTKLNGTTRIIEVVGNANYTGGPVQNIDPSGWYGYVGPALKATYVLSSKMWLDTYANYDFTVAKFFSPSNDYKKNPDYPMPTVLAFGADLYTTYFGLFGGVRVSTLTDKGSYENDAKRVDILVGFHF